MYDKPPRKEIAELVTKIYDGSGSEEEVDSWVRLLNSVHPQASDFIFWSFPPLSVEEVVDKIIAFEPTPMPPPASDDGDG